MLLKKKVKKFVSSQVSHDSGIGSQPSHTSQETQPGLPAFRNPFRNFPRQQLHQPAPLKAPIVSSSPRTRPAPRRLVSPGSSLSTRNTRVTRRLTQQRSPGSSLSGRPQSLRRISQQRSPGSSLSGRPQNLRRITQQRSPGSSLSGRPQNLRRITQQRSPGSSLSGRPQNLRRITPPTSQELSSQRNKAGEEGKTSKKRHEELSKDLQKILNSDAPLEKADEILDDAAELSEFYETLESARASRDGSPVFKRPRRAAVLSSEEEEEEEADFFVIRSSQGKKKSVKGKTQPKRAAREEAREAEKRKKKKDAERSLRSAPSTSRSRKEEEEKEEKEEEKFQFRIYSTWVECVRCLKWRHLRSVFDPAALPEDWECALNPDLSTAKAGCAAPEEACDEDTHQRSLLTSFTEGSLVWARVPGYPCWPAMVDRDPDLNSCYYLNPDTSFHEDLPEPSHYHVTFLDEDVSRAWVSTRHLKPFRGVADMKDKNFKTRGHDYRPLVLKTATLAERALEMDLETRLRKFGFAFRWTGVVNRWTAGEERTKKKKKKEKKKSGRPKGTPQKVREKRFLQQIGAETLALTSETNKLLDSIESQLRSSQC